MTHYSEVVKKPLQSECITYSRYDDIPSDYEAYTTNTVRCNERYVHYFRSKSIEIPCRNLMYTYNITVTSNKKCSVAVYTATCQAKMHVGCNVSNTSLVFKLRKGISKSFSMNFKRISLVTNIACVLHVSVVPTVYQDSYSLVKYVLTNNQDGHLTVNVPLVTSEVHTKPFARILHRYSSVPEPRNYTNIKYVLNTSSALTSTELVDSSSRYPPYSIRLPQVSGLVCVLRYRILIKASAEDNAEVQVTCIESLSRNRYAVIRDIKGSNISNTHTGQVLEGEFVLSPLPVDVGLHIYTCYGFSGDLGDDMKEDLIHINRFTIEYREAM